MGLRAFLAPFQERENEEAVMAKDDMTFNEAYDIIARRMMSAPSTPLQLSVCTDDLYSIHARAQALGMQFAVSDDSFAEAVQFLTEHAQDFEETQ